MSFQSLNPELTTKVLLLANLQRSLIQNQNVSNDKTAERSSTNITHPLLMPSLNVSSQKISAMLAALTPSETIPIQQTVSSNNNAMNSRTINTQGNMRSNGSSFGWGNRERKMEENWRTQNRNI